MNKNLFLILIFLFFPIIAISQVTHTISFSSEDLSFSTKMEGGDNYTIVSISDIFQNTEYEGKPLLPVKFVKLIVPFGQIVNGINVSDKITETYTITNDIYPVQSDFDSGGYFISPDSITYNSANAYPSDIAYIKHQGYYDGNNNIVTIGICPFEYYPITKQLKYVKSLTLTLSLSSGFQGGTLQITRLQHTQVIYDSILYDMVDNPEQINSCRIEPNIVDELGNTDSGLPVYEYVVVAPEDYTGALDEFISWKNQKGFYTGFVSIESILETYPAGDQIYPNYGIEDDAGSLRQYLHDAHNKGTIFAFLVGDASVMPIRYGAISDNPSEDSFWFNYPTTDWYFSDLTGNWNVDNDIFYGEPEDDNSHLYPSIYVGRLLCSSTQDIDNWVHKLLLYEKNPGNGNGTYLINSLTTCADGIQFSGYNYIDKLFNYIHDTLVELPNDSDSFPTFPKGSDIINQLNNKSYGLMNWFNHGGTGVGDNRESGITTMQGGKGYDSIPYNVWKLQAEDNYDYKGPGANPEIGNGLDNLTNYNTPFIIYSISCNVTPFDKTKSTNNNVRNCGESFTVNNLAGGVAFLGNTLDATSGAYIMFAKNLAASYYNTHYSYLGILESLSKVGLPNCYKHNLIGDPECQIWTKVPKDLKLEISVSELVQEINQQVEVKVSGFDTIEDSNSKCNITIYGRHNIFVSREAEIVNGVAIAVFDSVYPTNSTPITITATKHNYYPVEVKIPVIKNCETYITSTEVWQDDISQNCDIIITDGACLTIKCEVGMNVNNKIKVMPGGKLIIDGGKLFCSFPHRQWQGIRVIGNSSEHQYIINDEYLQGYCELKNNAIIQDAIVAVDLWNPSHYNTTGGIVHANNSYFINNSLSVRALYFENHNPISGKATTYNSYFKNCSFIINKDFAGQVLYNEHVRLTNVNGISFSGCSFDLDNNSEHIYEYNCGISSFNAGFTIGGYCTSMYYPCPEEYYQQSSFNGFYFGINAVGCGINNYAITVKNTNFDNNVHGIYLHKIDNATILFSDFHIGRDSLCNSGIYCDNSSGFIIEDNAFTKSIQAGLDSENYGIIVYYSRAINNIYNNTFDGLTCANFAGGKNWNKDIYYGLSYSCNSNNNNLVDFYVPQSSSPINDNSGIQSLQGGPDYSAGNTFSDEATWQFFNGANYRVSYFCNMNDTNEFIQKNKVFNVDPISVDSSNECISHYNNNNSIVLAHSEKLQREQLYYDAYNNYFSVKNLYDDYIDGGNTQEELSDIVTATSDDVWELRSQLLNHSPYLSQEVLMSLADRDDIFPESMIFEILASNPEELKKDTLIYFLENQNNPLPDYMIDILEQLASGITYRTVMESQLANYKYEYCRATGDIVRSILNDTIIDYSELRGYLGNQNTIDADMQIISSYIMEGDTANAMYLTNMLPELYELEGGDLSDYQYYKELINLYCDLYKESRNISQLDSTEIILITDIAENGGIISKNMAIGILQGNNNSTYYYDCPTLNLTNQSNKRCSNYIDFENFEKSLGLFMNISPNPANTWIAIDYILPVGIDKASIRIYNILGNIVDTIELIGNQGQRVIDTRSMQSGIYLLQLRCGELTKIEKFIISK